MNCPICDTAIEADNVNVKTDVAQCHSCGHLFKISEYLLKEPEPEFDPSSPPKGVWIERSLDKVIVGATTRSPMAFFLVPFMLVWSGGSLGGIYGSQIMSGKFDLTMSLFGIPFLLGALVFWGLTLMSIWGKSEITLDKKGGRVFTGVGSLGMSKKFTWDEINDIRERQTTWRNSRGHGSVLELVGQRRISFGTGVNNNRLYFVYRSVKILIPRIKENQGIE